MLSSLINIKNKHAIYMIKKSNFNEKLIIMRFDINTYIFTRLRFRLKEMGTQKSGKINYSW